MELSTDQIIALGLIGFIVIAVSLTALSYALEWLGILVPPSAVKRSADQAAAPPIPYGKQRFIDDGDDPVFRPSRREVEAEKAVEAAPEVVRKLAPDTLPYVTMTEKALQERDADRLEDGMIRAFAALSKGGYLLPGKTTEIKRLLFGVAGGRRLQRLNEAIDAVDLGALLDRTIDEPGQSRQLVVRDGAGERLIER